MADCPQREGTGQEHCWHPMTVPYSVAKPDRVLAPAIGECCCHCGAGHVKILMERPDGTEGHGEHLVFQAPKPSPAKPPAPVLYLPGNPRVRH